MLAAQFAAKRPDSHALLVCNLLTAICGELHPRYLDAAHVIEADHRIWSSALARSTKASRAGALRQILRWLHDNHDAPPLAQHVSRYPAARPRNVVATREEIDRILNTAAPHLRMFTLLCSDCAIRSGTAARLAPQHWNPQSRTLHFTTKYGAALSLPVTAELAAAIEACDLTDPRPFVVQLWPNKLGRKIGPNTRLAQRLRISFRTHIRRLGFTRRIIPHDLRRTAAVGIYNHTHDLRAAQSLLGHASLQSTVHYLDHDIAPLDRNVLEAIKRPFLVRKEQFA